MKKLTQHLPSLVVATMIASLFVPQLATAQDAAMQAGQAAIQAGQQAAQQAQQAAQQATDNAQRAAQQAMQDSMNAAQATSLPSRRPSQKPTVPKVPNGSVPAQIAAARSVFVASLGAAPNSPMDATEAYDQLVTDLGAWGHYTLAPTPQEADLIFELREIAPLTSVQGFNGDVESYSTPAFELMIRDERTHVVLWTVVSPLEESHKKTERERWFLLSVQNVVTRLKVLTRTPLTAQETADLTAMPKNHDSRNLVILTGVAVGAAAAGALILHHEFENSINSQKQQQDQFCMQNGIPLSECAGG